MSLLYTIIGIIVLLIVFYRIIIEIQDNYENKKEDEYILSLINEIRKIDPKVDQIVDQLRFFEGNKSYTIDKTYVFICKRDKKNGEMYHRNQLTLVLLHEISHALCPNVGHTKEFDEIFEDLLEKATYVGIYNPDPKYAVKNYCE